MGKPLWKRAKDYPSLSKAAREDCGGWNAALEKAGIDLELERQKAANLLLLMTSEDVPTRQRVIEEIRTLHAAGKPLWKRSQDYPELNKLARQHCGGWLAALESAGVLDR